MKPFVPEQPEKKMKVEITALEAHLLKCLRDCFFGRITVHKANGILIRVEPTKSILLSEEKGMDAVKDLL